MNALERLDACLLGAANAGDDHELRAAYTARARGCVIGIEQKLADAKREIEWNETKVKEGNK